MRVELPRPAEVLLVLAKNPKAQARCIGFPMK
jgi:hypothetical protein